MIYNYCAVIGVDGMGNFNKNANTPNMDKLFENGAVSFDGLSMDPTISAENWGAMLLGAAPTVHNLRNDIVSQYEYNNTELPSLFTRIRNKYPDAYLSSCCNWDPINYGIIEHNVNVDQYTADNDENLLPIILKCISKKPKFLFVQFDDCDGAGHGSGYGTENHIKQIETTDGYIGSIIEEYKKSGILNETLFIVISDHGGIRHGHGGYSDEEKYIFFGVSGNSVNKCTMDFCRTIDVAAVVLYSLGIEIPEYNKNGFSSQIPEGIFRDYKKSYFIPSYKPVKDTIRETPAFSSDKGLGSFIDPEIIKFVLYFDDCIKDETEKFNFKEYNTVKYYSTGIYGSKGELGNTGFISTDSVKISNDEFSVSFWIKADAAINEECVICSDKEWAETRKNKGFTVVQRGHNIFLNIGCGDSDRCVITPFPEGSADQWIHIIISYNKCSSSVKTYFNFEMVHSVKLENKYCIPVSFDKFFIGSDTSGKCNTETDSNIFYIDDFILFDKELSDSEVDSLKNYYNL